MKEMIYKSILLYFSIIVIVKSIVVPFSCAAETEEAVVKVYERDVSLNQDKEIKFDVFYKIIKLDVKKHPMSIYNPNSLVSFQLMDVTAEDKFVEKMEYIDLNYDKFTVVPKWMGGSFSKGDTWILSFNKKFELIKLLRKKEEKEKQ